MTATVLPARAVVTPDGVRADTEVVVEDGTITAVRAASGTIPERVLVPGFVDLQVNGIGDVDVAAAEGADWQRLDRALLAQGTTTWCPTLVSAPLDALDVSLARIAAAAARPPGARPTIAGSHLEGPFLTVRGAHRREAARSAVDDVGRAWLESLPPIVRVCTIAPEIPGALDALAGLAGRGVLVSLGHSACSAEVAADAADSGARLVTHLGNAMGALHHRAPGLLGAALADERLTPSLIADLVHCHPVFVRMVFAAKGPGGVALVTDAVATSASTQLAASSRASVSSVTGSDDPPRLADGTLAGSVLTMPEAIANVTDACGVPFSDAVRAASTTPAALLGLADRGAIAAGRRADLVALERNGAATATSPTPWRVATTWVAGTICFGHD